VSVKRALLLAVAAGLLVAGCGDDSTAETTTTGSETMSARVYFLRDGKVWPVYREIGTDGLWNPLLIEKLRLGPTEEERRLGLTSEVPDDLENLSKGALAQITYTLTQFPQGDQKIDIHGRTFSRADFEEQTPSVLVESPLAFEQVSSPLRITGTANTFEATFQYELLDGEGNVVDKNFVTATSGTGTRGTFDVTTGDFSDVATLVVFENSAEDGSRIHEVEIPLTVAP
jgi:germination protein M